MTNQEVKDYLMRYREAVKRAAAASERINELRAMAERITPKYGGSGSGQHLAADKLGEAVARLVDASEKVCADVREMEETEQEIMRVINAVNDLSCRMLLYERYICGHTWEQIAVNMHYSYRGITKMHGRALLAAKECIEVPTENVI